MNMKFILPFPPSVNARYQQSRGRRVKSAKVIAWELEAKNALNLQNVQPILGRALLEYSLNTPDGRNRDAGNYEKYVTDLLVSHGILKDDSSRHIKGIFIYWNDKPGKRIEVLITPLT